MSKSSVFTTKNDLTGLQPKHETFVGIDSDGCVFDTMEIKQKKCFHKLIVSNWRLEPIEKYLREAAEFVNLYSKHRGKNRFPCLVLSIDLLRDRPEVMASGVSLPEFKALKKFIESGLPLGNPALEKLVNETADQELASVLAWSKAVNKEIEKTVTNVPPYAWVLDSLQKIKANSDAICVSQTPTEALIREWQQHDLMGYVKVIAGQELGTKTEHIQMATRGRYQPDNILMIGDAPGDFIAAKGNKAHFYPINPGHEPESWERFYREAYDKFLRHEYGGKYEADLVTEFEQLLPETPPWKNTP
ncbi:MAG: HAD hydrolase-like protein [Verrucomicrobia bacterium]|nr:HAD hydrolase-like protein [Verrucomicrobiota bacterium]MCG2680142.1 HAD hydrolase-like protein [Kiritimatiellia bacterium]MBU4247051.1 HAD hydrolase-like protein [Verrucomicrobiota bacterium]MBU4291125.1 HAD hydrolase-like protein [Verrucomicrobiota bacterium]MBU4429299.1 HAD hydrolase-like protein [Verrucomicrobiota bacterium]